MTKNIAVIDEQGNRYEATYLKRAKGLVKSGRARFVDEKTICLARPPDKTEDKTMSENMGSINFSSENLNAGNLNAEKFNLENLSAIEDLKKSAAAYLDALRQEPGAGQEKALGREIVERVLDQLDHFAPDDNYLMQLATEHSVEGNDMVEVVSMRESTRQKQLEVYKTVLEKAIANEASAQVDFVDAMAQLERVTDWIAGLDCDDFDPETWEMIRTKAFELLERVTASVR